MGRLAHLTVGREWPRLDRYLAAHLDNISRTRIQELIRDGKVRINGAPAIKVKVELFGGEEISIDLPEGKPLGSLVPEPMDLDIIHEEASFAVINKPAGLVTHPGAGIATGTLANGLAAHFAGLPASGGPLRPGIVHRLDKDTSGLLVVAKSEAAHAYLSGQFERRIAAKKYQAIVWGNLPETGTIEEPIIRDPRNRVAFKVGAQGRSALTAYRAQELFEHFTLLEIMPRTGRTHQIRVHLSHLGHPVFGDQLYGGVRPEAAITPGARVLSVDLGRRIPRQALHASALDFEHPDTGVRVSFSAPLPADFMAALELLGEPGHGG